MGIELAANSSLVPMQGIAMLLLLGLISLGVAIYVKSKLVRNTHDFIICWQETWIWVRCCRLNICLDLGHGSNDVCRNDL